MAGTDPPSQADLVRLEGKIDTLMALSTKDATYSATKLQDHEQRIRDIEDNRATRAELGPIKVSLDQLSSWRWKQIGIYIGASTIMSAFVAIGEAAYYTNH